MDPNLAAAHDMEDFYKDHLPKETQMKATYFDLSEKGNKILRSDAFTALKFTRNPSEAQQKGLSSATKDYLSECKSAAAQFPEGDLKDSFMERLKDAEVFDSVLAVASVRDVMQACSTSWGNTVPKDGEPVTETPAPSEPTPESTESGDGMGGASVFIKN